MRAAAAFGAWRERWRWRGALVLALCSVIANRTNAQEADSTSTRTVVILNADRVTGVMEGGERVRRLVGRVRLRQDTTLLSADRATQFLDQSVTVFEGRVQISDGGDTLRARRVRYDQRARRGVATGAVSVSDSAVVLRAPSATYDAGARLSTFDEGAVITERRPLGASPDAAVATLTSRRGEYDTRRKQATFFDAVRLVDSTTVLTSQRGLYATRTRRADFAGDVRLVQPDTRLAADSIVHFRDDERSFAYGRVRIDRQERADLLQDAVSTDSLRSERAVLFGDQGYHDEAARYSRMTGQPLLVLLQRDTTAARESDAEPTPGDTLLVRARTLEAFRFDAGGLPPDLRPPASRPDSLSPLDSLARPESLAARPDSFETRTDSVALAPDTLELSPDSLAAPVAARSDSSSVSRAAPSPPGPRPLAPLIPRPEDRLLRVLATDSVRVVQRRLTAVADSAVLDRVEPPDADTLASDRDQLRLFGRSGAFAGRPRAWSDRLQLTADQVVVDGRGGDLDLLRAVGKAFAAQEDSALGRVQQIQGPQFEGRLVDGELNRLLVWPNAEAIHFRADTAGVLAGATQLSADSIAFAIAADTLRAVRAYRGIEGTYYEADLVPPDLRLSSYSLAPDLRPTRAALFPDSLALLLDQPIVPAPPIVVRIESLDSLTAPLAVVPEGDGEQEERREEGKDTVGTVPLLTLDRVPPVGPPALVGGEPVRPEAGGFGWLVTRSDAWAQAAWYGADGYRAAVLAPEWGGWSRPQVVLGQFPTREAALAARPFLPPDVPAQGRVIRLLPDGNALPEAE